MSDGRMIAEGRQPDLPPGPSNQVALRILLVEDNPDVRELYQTLLDLEGYRAQSVSTAPEGLEIVQRDPPDIALVDLELPGMDGCQFARQVRSTAAGSQVFLAALTGYNDAEARRRAQEAGFDAYLVKSVEFQELLALLAEQARRLCGERSATPARRLPR